MNNSSYNNGSRRRTFREVSKQTKQNIRLARCSVEALARSLLQADSVHCSSGPQMRLPLSRVAPHRSRLRRVPHRMRPEATTSRSTPSTSARSTGLELRPAVPLSVPLLPELTGDVNVDFSSSSDSIDMDTSSTTAPESEANGLDYPNISISLGYADLAEPPLPPQHLQQHRPIACIVKPVGNAS